MKRLHAIAAVCGVALLATGAGYTRAQSYPNRPVRLVVGFPPGGGADFVARVAAQTLSENLNQQVFVDNRPGANSIIACEFVARASPDGYTLLLGVTTSHAINPNVYSKLPYDAVKDFAPITNMGFSPLILVINPLLPVNSVTELIAFAKAKPGQLNFASAGNGNVTHLAAELFRSMTDVSMTHVPYKGSVAAITDLIAGQISLYFDSMPSSLPHVRGNRLRALAVTSAKRSRVAPDIPTVAESGVPGFEITNWSGVFAPAATPQDVVKKLNTELIKGLNRPELQGPFANQGMEVIGNTPEQFATALKSEIMKWRKIAEAANIRID